MNKTVFGHEEFLNLMQSYYNKINGYIYCHSSIETTIYEDDLYCVTFDHCNLWFEYCIYKKQTIVKDCFLFKKELKEKEPILSIKKDEIDIETERNLSDDEIVKLYLYLKDKMFKYYDDFIEKRNHRKNQFREMVEKELV
jgi:hypothetical protein